MMGHLPSLVFDFDTQTPRDIVSKPQGEFDFDLPSERQEAPSEQPDFLSDPQMNLDEMLTIEHRKSEQDKTDKI